MPDTGGTDVALYDDGFAESVPFQAVELHINRSRGEFTIDGDEQVRNSVVIIPRGSHKAQQYFANAYNPKNPQDPACASADGVLGFGRLTTDEDEPQVVRPCISCPKKGFGSTYCTDLLRVLAFDIEKSMPILFSLKNAEINKRKGVFPLAVNRFRSMGLGATDTLMKLAFIKDPAGGPFHLITIDVSDARKVEQLAPLVPEIRSTLDACWVALQASRQAHLTALKSAIQ